MKYKIGTLIDQLGKLEAKLKIEEAKLKPTKEKIRDKRIDIMQALNEEKTENGSGKLGKVSISRKTNLIIEDPAQFYKFVGRTKGYDLLPKSVNITAYNERIAAGKKVAGVRAEVVRVLRYTPSKKK